MLFVCVDITLADYANASVSSGKGRIRKSKTLSFVKEGMLIITIYFY